MIDSASTAAEARRCVDIIQEAGGIRELARASEEAVTDGRLDLELIDVGADDVEALVHWLGLIGITTAAEGFLRSALIRSPDVTIADSALGIAHSHRRRTAAVEPSTIDHGGTDTLQTVADPETGDAFPSVLRRQRDVPPAERFLH